MSGMESQATTRPSQFTAGQHKKEVRNRSGQDDIRFGEGLIVLVANQFTGRKNRGSGQEQARSGKDR